MTAKANMDEVNRFIKDLPTLIKQLETLIKAAIPLVKALKEGCSSLKKVLIDDIEDLYKKNEDLQIKASLKSEFQQMNYQADVFVASVNKVFRYCSQQSEMSAMIKKVNEGDFDCLKDFLKELGRLLAACEKKYQLFEKELKEIHEKANTTAAMFDKLSSEADLKKKVVKVGGGALATGFLATGITAAVGAVGVTASTIAGLFSFGIGTAIGLVITSAAVAGVGGVAGAGTAVITVFAAHHYDKLARGFSQSAEAVEEMQKNAAVLSDRITTLKANVNEIRETADNLNELSCNASERASICGAIRLLCQTCASSAF